MSVVCDIPSASPLSDERHHCQQSDIATSVCWLKDITASESVGMQFHFITISDITSTNMLSVSMMQCHHQLFVVTASSVVSLSAVSVCSAIVRCKVVLSHKLLQVFILEP